MKIKGKLKFKNKLGVPQEDSIYKPLHAKEMAKVRKDIPMSKHSKRFQIIGKLLIRWLALG